MNPLPSLSLPAYGLLVILGALLVGCGSFRSETPGPQASLPANYESVTAFPAHQPLILYGSQQLYDGESQTVRAWQPTLQSPDEWRDAPLSFSRFLVSADGSARHPIESPWADGGAWVILPTQSPDPIAWQPYVHTDADGYPLASYPAEHWSPDGQFLVGAGLSIRSLTDPGTVESPNWQSLWQLPPGKEVVAPRWSPDGTQIAFALNDTTTRTGELWLYDVAGQTASPMFTIPVQPDQVRTIHDLSWSPDGSHLAFISTLDRGCRGGAIGITGEYECYFDLYTIQRDGSGLEWVVKARGSTYPTAAPAVFWIR